MCTKYTNWCSSKIDSTAEDSTGRLIMEDIGRRLPNLGIVLIGRQ